MLLKQRFLLFAVFPLVACISCGGSRSGYGFDTPEKTFATVRKAVADRNIDLYKSCFTAEAIERGEAMLAKYEKRPEFFWKELDGLFKGPQSIRVDKGEMTARGSVTAPEADGEGIGTISFKKVEGEWKIASW